MKKLFWIILVIPFFFGCNQKKIEQLTNRGDSLQQLANQRDSSIIDFLQAFNEIQANLDTIKSKEMIITEMTAGKTELQKNDKDQINEDIKKIYQLLVENKEKVSTLKKKLSGSNAKIVELETMLNNLTKQVEEKNIEIEGLKAELGKLNIQVESLSKDVANLTEEGQIKSQKIQQQTEEINAKTEELNTAYYIVGTQKELKAKNVLTKEGGFIGIGANKKLKPDFDQSLFTKVDITKLKVIPCPGKKANVITNHPTGAYQITGEKASQTLEIKDYKEFWKSSKYLVIVISE